MARRQPPCPTECECPRTHPIAPGHALAISLQNLSRLVKSHQDTLNNTRRGWYLRTGGVKPHKDRARMLVLRPEIEPAGSNYPYVCLARGRKASRVLYYMLQDRHSGGWRKSVYDKYRVKFNYSNNIRIVNYNFIRR